MHFHIILSPDAEADINAVVWWYQSKDLKVALRFRAEADATLQRIAQFPYRYQLINSRIRRASLRRFPYSIFFYLNMAEVFVIAVIHQRRNHLPWIDRGNGHRFERKPP